jgi:hypothetical protein
MRTYDPAERIRYVHLGSSPAAPTAAPPAPEDCHRLPAGYANASVRAWAAEGRTAGTRTGLVLRPGGAAASAPAPAARARRLAVR